MQLFFWGKISPSGKLPEAFSTCLVKSKDLDASNSPNSKPHDLRLAAISTAPLVEIAEGSIPSVLVELHFVFNFMDVVSQLVHIHLHHLTLSNLPSFVAVPFNYSLGFVATSLQPPIL